MRPRYYRERTSEPERPPTGAEARAAAALPPHLDVLAGLGNAAVARLLQRAPATTSPPSTRPRQRPIEERIVIQVAGEWIEVETHAEAAEAERIVALLKQQYGIELSSAKSVKAVRQAYSQAPKGVRETVRVEAWTLDELRALMRAVAHFAPILGKNRAASTRKGAKQEVTSAGKATHGIDEDSKYGEADDTLAQYFAKALNVTMFKDAGQAQGDFGDDKVKQLEGTLTHELAHGLLEYALDDFIAGLEYWDDDVTRSFKEGAEAPITKAGTIDAHEDLAEAAMMYFLEPKTLEDGKGQPHGTPGNPCKKRFALIDRLVKSWKQKRS